MRRIGLYGIIIFQLILIGSLIRGIQTTLVSRKRIALLEEKKRIEEQKAEELKRKEEYVQSDYYLEKVAREELHLSQPGETVVIIPEAITTGQKPADAKAMAGEEEKPNWQKWWEVVSGKK